jgi:dipeptidyl aminopeptidase/acylaminoacyl peptidase
MATRRDHSPRLTTRAVMGAAAAGLLWLGLVAAPALARRDPTPFAAKAGLDVARAAASAWAGDAALVYLENDEALDAQGAAGRWGYLFYSPTLDQARVYSVSDGTIVVAERLDMKFEAPPIAGEWIDSGAALAAAESGGAAKFRREEGGQLSTMLLVRGAFHAADPDPTTWTLVYSAPHAPSLFVVVDAADGKVRRVWRG